MKTKSIKQSEIQKKWILIDAKGAVVGRLASFIALRLKGKHKPEYTPHMDCGDNVIVINAGDVVMTGNNKEKENYYWHTGYMGGIKSRTKGQLREQKPEKFLKLAIQRMMPKDSPLARQIMTNIRIYAGSEHPHEAQNPEMIDFKSLNPKNVRGA